MIIFIRVENYLNSGLQKIMTNYDCTHMTPTEFGRITEYALLNEISINQGQSRIWWKYCIFTAV